MIQIQIKHFAVLQSFKQCKIIVKTSWVWVIIKQSVFISQCKSYNTFCKAEMYLDFSCLFGGSVQITFSLEPWCHEHGVEYGSWMWLAQKGSDQAGCAAGITEDFQISIEVVFMSRRHYQVTLCTHEWSWIWGKRQEIRGKTCWDFGMTFAYKAG